MQQSISIVSLGPSNKSLLIIATEEGKQDSLEIKLLSYYLRASLLVESSYNDLRLYNAFDNITHGSIEMTDMTTCGNNLYIPSH